MEKVGNYIYTNMDRSSAGSMACVGPLAKGKGKDVGASCRLLFGLLFFQTLWPAHELDNSLTSFLAVLFFVCNLRLLYLALLMPLHVLCLMAPHVESRPS